MVKVIVGLKGSGKTKQLIDSINTAIKTESGSMVCIEKGNALTFDIDYRVRLIDASEYDIGSYTFLKGFTKDNDETAAFLDWCEAFGNANKMEFTISISADLKDLPESVTKYL